MGFGNFPFKPGFSELAGRLPGRNPQKSFKETVFKCKNGEFAVFFYGAVPSAPENPVRPDPIRVFAMRNQELFRNHKAKTCLTTDEHG